MKRLLPLLLAGGLLFGAAACSRQSRPVLRLYNWAAYISDDVVKAFEKEFNCRVVIDVFDSNEAMYAKLKAGGGGYDVIVPSSYQVIKLRDEGMIRRLDPSLIPNLVHIDPKTARFTQDSSHAYSVPYFINTTGLGYRKDRAPDLRPTWAVLEDEQFKGRMTILNDMRETLGAALKANGHSLNSTNPDEIAAARDRVIAWKKNAAKFESEQFKDGLVSAEFVVVMGYSSDVLQAAEENPNVGFLKPVEGMSVAMDELAILTDAPNPELAHAFINFLHRPDVAAVNMQWVQALCPNVAAYELVEPEFRANEIIFLTDEDFAKAETIFDIGEAERLYIEAWNAIKSAP